MAMRARSASTVVMFDVLYEDGTRTSNRKVLSSALEGLDGDEPAQGIIEAQDKEIGAASGRPRPGIKSVYRSPVKVQDDLDPKAGKKAGKR